MSAQKNYLTYVIAGLLTMSVIVNVILLARTCGQIEVKSEIKKTNQTPVMMETMFVNFNPDLPQSKGVLIFKNIGSNSYDYSKFKLYLDDKLQDNDGCELKNEIDPGELCSLNLYEVCNPGDVLNIEYGGNKIVSKLC
ncbi:MAG: hypothetical protein QXD13_00580 [Candidatus Pacearchaeota archaeon]